MILEIEDRLIEQVVLEAIYRQPNFHFYREREALYAVENPDARHRAFADLHGRWFHGLRLDRSIHDAFLQQPLVEKGIDQCVVTLAARAADEGSQLYVQRGDVDGQARRRLAIRLLPTTLVNAPAARRLLDRELLYVADMLDPTFGYQPRLPPSPSGPVEDRLRIDRYAAAWAVTVTGRLAERQLLPANAREQELSRFQGAFPMLGENSESLFDRLFRGRPTHAELVEIALRPQHTGLSGESRKGTLICPLCKMPAAALWIVSEAEAQQAVAREFSDWEPSRAVCIRCAEVYTGTALGTAEAHTGSLSSGSAGCGWPKLDPKAGNRTRGLGADDRGFLDGNSRRNPRKNPE